MPGALELLDSSAGPRGVSAPPGPFQIPPHRSPEAGTYFKDASAELRAVEPLDSCRRPPNEGTEGKGPRSEPLAVEPLASANRQGLVAGCRSQTRTVSELSSSDRSVERPWRSFRSNRPAPPADRQVARPNPRSTRSFVSPSIQTPHVLIANRPVSPRPLPSLGNPRRSSFACPFLCRRSAALRPHPSLTPILPVGSSNSPLSHQPTALLKQSGASVGAERRQPHERAIHPRTARPGLCPGFLRLNSASN